MKKIILFIVSIFLSFSFSFAINYSTDLNKYWGNNASKIVDKVLDKWNNKILSTKDEKNILNKYNKVLWKIDNLLNKKISQKVRILLVYVKFKLENYKSNYLKNIEEKKKLEYQKKLEEEKKMLDISKYYKNYETLKKDSIITPVSGSLYWVLWFSIKPLYADAYVNSFLFKNEYWNEADYNIKNAYLLSSTGAVLWKTKIVNGILFFSLKKPVNLIKDWNNSFYVLVELNDINSLNQTNKKIKLKLLKKYNTFETKIITKVNWNPAYWLNNTFNSHTYFIRKSKPIFKNVYRRWRLIRWNNKIYSFDVSSTWWIVTLKKINLSLNVSPYARIDTWNMILYIDNSKYNNVRLSANKENGNVILTINFNGKWYDLYWKKRFDIEVFVKRVVDHWYIVSRIKSISNYTNKVTWNYNWPFSILYSDNAVKWSLTENTNDYFTDAKLYLWNITDNYLTYRK